ncbi:TetR/AcrR family transcriptional regulator C-terminal domain-containing protein [Paenibacillus sp. GCM10027627]|uniref:TetR/AcrR family transcriptional regulator n=1 Tax=unclassified Paenibacillus TaxID=185978 RepID=UPI00363D9A99
MMESHTENQSPDRRVLRTKRLIRDALTELMEEKGFDGITVKDLTERADINRGTFYIHYKDKYDLLEQSEAEVIQEFAKIAASSFSIVANVHKHPQDKWNFLPFVEKLFETVQQNGAFMRVILGPRGNPSFQKKLKDVIKEKGASILSIIGAEIPVPAPILTAYVSSAHLGVIQNWLETGMRIPPKEMAHYLAQLTLLGPGYIAGVTREDRFDLKALLERGNNG